ncbi:MAG: L-histidine N(alpha)-methyltransferase [Rhodospirillaceae bacterium]
MTSRAYSFHDLHPCTATLRDDVLHGLSQPRKALPPKYFYDTEGSALFERICTLPEYYPTRTEMEIMRLSARAMADRIGPRAVLIEYGSGSGLKTRVLLEALRPVAYVPIDISTEQLQSAAAQVARQFAEVKVVAVCADYSEELHIESLDDIGAARRAVYFSGSTIGNFTPEEAHVFLQRARTLVQPGGAMLVGVDLKKDHAVLHAAYNDAQGVTAQFNLNLLERLNRELGADFDVSAWSHRAFYNADLGRIEMHLESERDQRVTIAGKTFDFRRGETIHTENSYKYTIDGFQALASGAGFSPQACWSDPARYFSVHYLVAQ